MSTPAGSPPGSRFVRDYIYHTVFNMILALSGRCARLVEDPLSLEMIVSMTASSDSIRKFEIVYFRG